ncbi:hypothetical protein JTE90_010998 [Oedothorax gibbosus]|uniref:Uncharacterized protein n=1 Tax=Oedothorax gibbosus TaxID=931172 RepID=A0AAV6VCJ4_9ARAC|nr:hypothetical protein JTE90_010998 [Oedothorax gibbosus]
MTVSLTKKGIESLLGAEEATDSKGNRFCFETSTLEDFVKLGRGWSGRHSVASLYARLRPPSPRRNGHFSSSWRTKLGRIDGPWQCARQAGCE